jgi:hypothetical protein
MNHNPSSYPDNSNVYKTPVPRLHKLGAAMFSLIRINVIHNEELSDLYCSAIIFWVIKWRRIRWAGHVEHMGKRRGVHRVFGGET